MDWLRKAVKPMDILIAIVGLYLLLFTIDYSNMSTLDIVYLVCFGIWFVMLAVRIYIYWKGK